MLKQFVLWINVPVEQATCEKLTEYVGYLLCRKLKPKTINCHIGCIRAFYEYLQREEILKITNPVRKKLHPAVAEATAPIPK